MVVIRKPGEEVLSFTDARNAYKKLGDNPPEGVTSIELWSSDGGLLQRRKCEGKPAVPIPPTESEPPPTAHIEHPKRHKTK